MYLDVAEGAVLEAGTADIVERRGHGSQRRSGRHRRSGKIRVAFLAKLADTGTRQHAGIYAAMGFMAGAAAFHANGSVVEGERPDLIAMAFRAAGLIGDAGLKHSGLRRPVGVVA